MTEKKQLIPKCDRGLLCVSRPGETAIHRLPRLEAYSIVEKGGKLHPRHEWRAQRKKTSEALEALVEETEKLGGYDAPSIHARPQKSPKGKKREVPEQTPEQKEYWSKKNSRKNRK